MRFTHLNEDGIAYMVDITAKDPTVRQASAVCRMDCSPEVIQALHDGTVPKDDVLAMAHVAGISAAGHVPGLLPPTHTIGVHGCAVDLSLEDNRVAIRATVHMADRMDVRMEAPTSVMVAALAIVGMVRGVDRSARIREARIVVESGGRSGNWVHPEDP